MPNWSYQTLKLSTQGWLIGGKVDENQLDEHMNRLGMNGWELVAGFNTTQSSGMTRDIVLIFKRAK